ncbi:DUF2059 domain-containing protein [Ancylobacter dichloromethanicus]|uniref:DUF2059 domain-containing protein n=1 Tax=Ancylobacter dichloromethanicus TaxID=518825 RepID=A0A9W6J5T6_9HYPH|nr:DUF2059 domain-containing protein [Ancylobacter dichloromethanicus]MBS7553020.1 DUF2059 domain-containing protein [Ancylobacter dichloromethanicus]GLK70341.1 hypothetical protein GCM10017643_04560 [Ancylobacter dichloromethanicus]
MQLDIAAALAARFAGVALAAGVLAAVPARAQEPPPFQVAQAATATAPEPSAEQMKLANDLLVANGEASSFDAVIPNVVEQTAASFVQANPDLIRDLREVAKQLSTEYESRRSEIVEILAKIYATEFTTQELKDLLAFYRSEAGKKLVAKREDLLKAGFSSIQAWSALFAREMEGRVREEMKKRGFTI